MSKELEQEIAEASGFGYPLMRVRSRSEQAEDTDNKMNTDSDLDDLDEF